MLIKEKNISWYAITRRYGNVMARDGLFSTDHHIIVVQLIEIDTGAGDIMA